MAVLPTGRGRLDSCGSSCQITIRSISSTVTVSAVRSLEPRRLRRRVSRDLLRVLKGTPVGQDAVIPVARKVVAPGASTDATRATRRSSTVARGSANSRAGATRRRREPRRAPRRRLPPRASGHLPTGYRQNRRRRSLRGRRRRAVADAPSAPKPITVVRPDSMPPGAGAGGSGPAGAPRRRPAARRERHDAVRRRRALVAARKAAARARDRCSSNQTVWALARVVGEQSILLRFREARSR